MVVIFTAVDCLSYDLLLGNQYLGLENVREVDFADRNAMLLSQHDLEEHFLADRVDLQFLETNNFIVFVHVFDDDCTLLGIIALDLDRVFLLSRVNDISEEFLLFELIDFDKRTVLVSLAPQVRAGYDLVVAELVVDVFQLENQNLLLLLVDWTTKTHFLRLELSKRQFFKIMELSLDSLVDLLFNIKNDVELARAGLEHLAVAGTEDQALWVVVEETIQVFKFNLVHRL